MIKRYVATLYKPSIHNHDYSACASRAFRSLETAQAQAARWLAKHVIYTTRHFPHGHHDQDWGVEIVDAKTDLTVDIVEPEIVFVASAGDLGYW